MSNKFYVVKLGCDKNDVDADVMRGLISTAGFQEVEDPEMANIIIVNTCGFIKAAKEESIDAILAATEQSNNVKVYVTGCLAERYADELAEEIPEVVSFIGVGHFEQMAEILQKDAPDKIYKENKNIGHSFTKRKIDNMVSAFVKIADGCNSRCSYCAIPTIKGNYQSRDLSDIISEVRLLASSGVKEINLVAQNTTAYGMDLNTNVTIIDLLKSLLEVEGIEWFRLLYCYPGYISEELIELIAKEDRIASYLDIPIQHAHPEILKAMKRGARQLIKPEWFSSLRERINNLTLRTTLIVGFPGETDEEYEYLKEFINEVKFDHLGVFGYSEEENTDAASLKGKVSQETINERLNELVDEQKYIAYARKKHLVGKVFKVIIEKKLSRTRYEVRSEANAPGIDASFYVESNNDIEIGQVVMVRIDEINFDSLLGSVI
jgi:ribosomal protein S12 methylthiotransferase